MLYLGNGAREVKVGEEGEERLIQLFPDSVDPLQWYYLPNFPHVAKMQDGTPAIRLLVYREDLDEIEEGDEEAVAFLSLDVDVSWPPEVVETAAKRLKRDEDLDEEPRLTPIFYREGSVKLMLLDAVTPDEEVEATDFVTTILGSGSPSLYGDNRAIFQASLPKRGAAALSGALDGVTPIGVVYSLTFAGLQPAFNVRAKVDWQKVYDHFSEQEKTDLLFYEKEIQKSIDSLRDERVIEIESTIEGVGAEAMQSEHDKVMDEVRQLIFDTFFEATFEREDPTGGSTADDVVDTLTQVHKNALTLGVGYTYRRKEVKVEELRTFDLDYSVRKAALRTIYPQAHMHNVLTEGGVTRDQLITVVDGSDEVWKVLPFEVTAAAAWDTDGIVGITVDIEYEDEDGSVRSWSTHLDPEKDSDTHRAWMDRTDGNRFRYKYEVVFADDAVPGPSPKVNSGEWREHEGTILVLHPRELYETQSIEIEAQATFPFDRWPAVHAFFRYRAVPPVAEEDTDSEAESEREPFVYRADEILSAESRVFSRHFRVNRGEEGVREMALVYLGATGERHETGWMPMPNQVSTVTDPQSETLAVRGLVAGDREALVNLVVDFEYVDEENGIHESGSLEWTQEDLDPKSWLVHIEDPTKRRYRYRMTLVTNDGGFTQTGWIESDTPTLPLGRLFVRQMTVEVQTGELADGIERVEVKLAYHDDVNDVHEEREFTLGSNARGEWMVQLQDASRRSYEVTTTWVRTDGFSITAGPTSETRSLLTIPPEPPDGG